MILFTGCNAVFATPPCGKKIKIAVIDSGLSQEVNPDTLCHFGHKDFTDDKRFISFRGIPTRVPEETYEHGAHIAQSISEQLKGVDYCLVILKVFSGRIAFEDRLGQITKAIRYATRIGVDFINFSASGREYDKEEAKAVTEFINAGGTFIAAAGNDGMNLDANPAYPAMDDRRVICVGALDNKRNVADYSNYGKAITRWELGKGTHTSGTSQATAVATGKIVKTYDKGCKRVLAAHFVAYFNAIKHKEKQCR